MRDTSVLQAAGFTHGAGPDRLCKHDDASKSEVGGGAYFSNAAESALAKQKAAAPAVERWAGQASRKQQETLVARQAIWDSGSGNGQEAELRISVGGRDSMWAEIFGHGASTPSELGIGDAVWPGCTSKRRLGSPRSGSPRDQLGRGLAALGGAEPSCLDRSENLNDIIHCETFGSARKAKGSFSGALSHQTHGERRAGSPRGLINGEAESGETPLQLVKHSWEAAGKATERIGIFGSPQRLRGFAPPPTACIPAVGPEEHALSSARSASPRRSRGASPGPASRLLGVVNVCEDNEDVAQREIFGHREKWNRNDRRRRGVSPDQRMLTWPVQEKAVYEDPPPHVAGPSNPLVPSLENRLEASAGAPGGWGSDEGAVGIFGSHRRQLRSVSPARKLQPDEGDVPLNILSWVSAPLPSKPSPDEPDGCSGAHRTSLQWPENRSRRLRGVGDSPRGDQSSRSVASALSGECRHEGPAMQAQLDLFGSPRRMSRSPSPRNATRSEIRAGSPAARVWRWLGDLTEA